MSSNVFIREIVSGGQTGADRAALDAAIAMGVPYGGWLPKGRKTEEGPLPLSYGMLELKIGGYPKRTEKNVEDSDGTLIVSHGALTDGSRLTQRLAHKHKRPCLHLDCNTLTMALALAKLTSWLYEHQVHVLNVAGPRMSTDPAIYDVVKKLITSALQLK